MGGGGGTAENPEGYVEGQEYTENGENGEQNGEQNGQPAQSVGFAAGLMMKAHSLKEGVKEKGAGMNLGNVQVGVGVHDVFVLRPHYSCVLRLLCVFSVLQTIMSTMCCIHIFLSVIGLENIYRQEASKPFISRYI